jgi:hypothetical protein
MSTITRDLMLVCRNGHVITDRLKANPDRRSPRCDRCGADTLDRCETCGHLLGGSIPVPGFEPIGPTRLPAWCSTCGAAFPWTAREEPPDDEPLTRLLRLLRRLPRAVRELRMLPGAAISVRDDRDLDRVIRPVLALLFDDIRPETYTPPYSLGNRTRFLLPEAGAALIGHLVGPGVAEEQLAFWRRHDTEPQRPRPGFRTLVFFVHDPERRLPDPTRLESVWSRDDDQLTIRCVIAN